MGRDWPEWWENCREPRLEQRPSRQKSSLAEDLMRGSRWHSGGAGSWLSLKGSNKHKLRSRSESLEQPPGSALCFHQSRRESESQTRKLSGRSKPRESLADLVVRDARQGNLGNPAAALCFPSI